MASGQAVRRLAVVGIAMLASGPAAAGTLAQWVQHDGEGLSVRLITDAATCPDVVFDGQPVAMDLRAAPTEAFPPRVCSAPVPDDATSAAVDGAPFALPDGRLDRIVVIGDTGCRIKGKNAQDCDDPADWPFAKIAAAAAATKPDLVIHVGDYLYRESECPAGDAGCAGSPWGDNWTTWSADFFAPAAPLLAAAPWIMVRGNHETCDRAGTGWARAIGTAPPAPDCPVHVPAYTVSLDGQAFAVLDAAAAPDDSLDPAIEAALRPEIAAAADTAAAGPTWLVLHKPMYGIVRLESGRAMGVSRTLAAAADGRLPQALDLVLSGHVHTFESLSYGDGEPPQLIVGVSGTKLDPALPDDLSGLAIGDLTVVRGLQIDAFGFLVLDRVEDGWDGTLLDPDGKTLATCTLDEAVLDCRPAT